MDLLWNFARERGRERERERERHTHTHTHTLTSDTIIQEEQSGELEQRVARKQQNKLP
jgi:hypothetical protein